MNAQLKVKAIAAVAAFALSGAAAASTLEGEEMIFSAWNGNPDAASSIVINLGLTTSAFRANPNGSFELSGDSLTTLTNWLTSLGSGISGVQWNVTGAMLGAPYAPDYGMLTTSNNVPTANPEGWGGFTLDAVTGNTSIFFNEVNGNLAATDAFFAANPNQLFSGSFNGGYANVNTFGSVGDSLSFYQLFADQGGNEFFEGDFLTFAHTWTLDFTGGVASLTYAPVPLPAAVWLLGSGLIGLMGIGRRKAA
jgi:hypothetical protein